MDAAQELLDAVGLVPAPPERERLQWIAHLRDGTTVDQYGPDGAQRRFVDLPAGAVARVILHALLPIQGAPVEFVDVLAAVLHVPEGAKAELLYRGGVDVTMSGGVITGQVAAPRLLLCGWRYHDGSQRECWVLVQPDGSAHAGLDPQRPWPV